MKLKTQAQIAGIRESGKRNTELLDYITEQIADGITTGDIDRLVHEKTLALGGYPAPLGYQGFPKSVCVSVGNEVCHGIPDDSRVLTNGDMFNIDVTTIYKDYYADASRMFSIGELTREERRLIRVAKECVDIGVTYVRPRARMGDMGAAVHRHAKRNGYSVVREIGGHGVGCEFHEDPFVSFVSRRGTGVMLNAGMVFTIEPMVNLGGPEVYQDEENGWTIYTADGEPSAQWEYTVCVTESGCEILTS